MLRHNITPPHQQHHTLPPYHYTTALQPHPPPCHHTQNHANTPATTDLIPPETISLQSPHRSPPGGATVSGGTVGSARGRHRAADCQLVPDAIFPAQSESFIIGQRDPSRAAWFTDKPAPVHRAAPDRDVALTVSFSDVPLWETIPKI